uniref:Uncharacterized protein n=1 Tax=Arundo donax TaxID=35708 RepID=A0A0A9D6T6_ARUDO
MFIHLMWRHFHPLISQRSFSFTEYFLAAPCTFSMYPSLGGVRVAVYRFAGKGVMSGTNVP